MARTVLALALGAVGHVAAGKAPALDAALEALADSGARHIHQVARLREKEGESDGKSGCAHVNGERSGVHGSRISGGARHAHQAARMQKDVADIHLAWCCGLHQNNWSAAARTSAR